MYSWLESIVWPLTKATGVTLSLAVAALVCGLVLALIFALLESAPIKWLAKLATGLVMLIRGLPEVLVVIAIYNGIPLLLGVLADGFNLNLGFHQFWIQVEIEDFDVNPILCGIIALSLLYACYASQTLRGAFKAISSGQQRAAEALGLSKARTLWRIILPQMWHHALPGLGNQWLVLLKDTALVSLIAVNDIMLQTRTIISNQQHPFMWYLIAAAIYLIISLFSQSVLQRIERKSRYYEQQGVNHG